MNTRRDILDRLDRASVGYYVTGSEALSIWAEPRQTLDIDLVIDVPASAYDAIVRPAFEDAYLVNDLVETATGAYGGVIHRTEIEKADLVLRRDDPWSRSAFDRRREVDDPALGRAWVVSPEDLVLAKLAWSDGGASERQVRDAASIVRLHAGLDEPYLDRFARLLGVQDLLEAIRGDR